MTSDMISGTTGEDFTRLEQYARRAVLLRGVQWGSGYALADGLVLTSRHVVGKLRTTCLVRPEAGDEFIGTVLWTSDKFDAALVSVASDPWQGLDTRFSWAVLTGPGLARCLTLGYPWVGKAGEERRLLELEWKVSNTTGWQTGSYELHLDNSSPRDRVDRSGRRISAWSGLSGGPVLTLTGQLLGIVRDEKDNYRNSALGAVRISSLLADDEFKRLVEAAETKPIAISAQESSQEMSQANNTRLDSVATYNSKHRLHRYLVAACRSDIPHPYGHLLNVDATLAEVDLSSVYLSQQVNRDSGPHVTETERVAAETLVSTYRGGQIVGGPGAGKSSLLRRLTGELARTVHETGTGNLVPVFVPAAVLAKHGGSLPEFLSKAVTQTLYIDLDQAALIELFKTEPLPGAKWLVLVDGVDEILDPSSRGLALANVAHFRQEGRMRFFVTTRPLPEHVMTKVTSDLFPTFTIEPFGRDQLQKFAEKWFRLLCLPDPDMAAIQFETRVTDARIGDLATNPLIATMMCRLFAADRDQPLPTNRAELYDRFVNLLLGKREMESVHERLAHWTARSGGPSAVASAEDLWRRTRPLLQSVAFAEYRMVFDHAGVSGRADPAREFAKAAPPPPGMTAVGWSDVIDAVLRSCGLLDQHGRGEFGFVHQTITEFLAASYVVERHNDPRSRAAMRFLRPQDWHEDGRTDGHEVKIFLVALWSSKGDVTRMLSRLLKRRYCERTYTFLVDLVRQHIVLPERVAARLIQVLIGWVVNEGVSFGVWRSAAESLALVSPADAATQMRLVAERDCYGFQRRIEAARILLESDRPVGLHVLEQLTIEPGPDGPERLRAAKLLYRNHQRRGRAALERLALTRGLEDWRTEAAMALDEANPVRAQELVFQIARDPHAAAETRLGAGRMLRGELRAVALIELSQVTKAGGRIRLDAAIAANRFDENEAEARILAISYDDGIDSATRNSAAEYLEQHERPGASGAFAAIASSATAAPVDRAQAALRFGKLDELAGPALQLKLAAIAALGDARVDLALAAAVKRADEAADVLADLAGVRFENEYLAIRAAQESFHLRKESGAKAFENIRLHQSSPRLLYQACLTFVKLDPALGEKSMDTLVRSHAIDRNVRFDVAIELHRHNPTTGAPALHHIVAYLSPSRIQIRSLAQLAKTDHVLARDLLAMVATNKDVPPEIRVASQKEIPMRHRAVAQRLEEEFKEDPQMVAYFRSLEPKFNR
ncbi:trypsin-like peptidase domain-containing protein [Amycolatopsis sp. NPDC051758]|uniref:trypsin-like peptidase domain-containing protein n=1 Tax=Amycolatopsis sp. NPDC051758 TaxID=3363935 RepID=UPI00379F3CF1